MFGLGAVLTVAVAAGSSAASPGLYTGKTSQKLKITVKVSNGKIAKLAYVIKYGSCGEFSGADTHISIERNKFSATIHPNSEVTDKLSGTFRGRAVSGTLSSSLALGGIHPSTCRSGKGTFSAKL